LTPGFLTDIAGIFFLIPVTRSLLKVFLKKKFQQMIRQGEIISFGNKDKPKKRGYEKYDDADFS
jgi:UPF0716 protein FxsA